MATPFCRAAAPVRAAGNVSSLVRGGASRNYSCRLTESTRTGRQEPLRNNPIIRPARHTVCGSRALNRSIRTQPRGKKSLADDRGPVSKEDTQTDFGKLDMLANTSVPTTAIDACLEHGFALNSGLKINGSGVLLLAGEAFRWNPHRPSGAERDGERRATTDTGSPRRQRGDATSRVCNAKGQFEIQDAAAWGLLDLVWPRPDLLVLGTGNRIVPVSPATRQAIADLGIRLEVQDTRNAAAQFNLLATERGVQQVAAALVPVGA